jgi:hypothetical protein
VTFEVAGRSARATRKESEIAASRVALLTMIGMLRFAPLAMAAGVADGVACNEV